jgi:hypothetical protein
MRILALFLALLAIGKIAVVQTLYRSASDDVIVNAYRPRAIDACSRDAQRQFGLDAAAWSRETSIKMEIGRRSNSPIYIWQINHPAWSERYRNPYLHLATQAPGFNVTCVYDVVSGTTAISKS